MTDWPVLEPGTGPWWDCVQRLGVARHSVELTLRIVANDRALEDIDPHAVWFDDDASAAERVVTFVLLAYHVPKYAAFMYVAHRWDDARRSLQAFPFDEDIPHQREAVPHEGSTALFRIEGSVEAVRAALGEIVDAWPPGLGPGSGC